MHGAHGIPTQQSTTGSLLNAEETRAKGRLYALASTPVIGAARDVLLVPKAARTNMRFIRKA